MLYTNRKYLLFVLILVFLIFISLSGSNSQGVIKTDTSAKRNASELAEYMVSERYDFRLAFFEGVENFDTVQKKGAFLLIPDGVFEHAIEVFTNACPTVKCALDKYASARASNKRQIRIIKKNCVLQTPKQYNVDTNDRKKILLINLLPGDVVVVTRVE
jgi:translation initiation factor IF-1